MSGEIMDELKKMRFDPRIDLGHILTFLGFVLTIFIGWTNLDKRVVVLEQNDKHQNVIISNQSTQIKDSLNDLKSYLIRLEQKVDEVNNRRE